MDVLTRKNGARGEETNESVTANLASRAMSPTSRDTFEKQGVRYCQS